MTPPPPPVFHRASAPSLPSPEPVLPDEEFGDKLDFLGDDPFAATLAKVEALYLAGEDLSASNRQFSLPTSDPRNHRKAMRDTDSERWRLSEHNDFTSLQNKNNVFHPRSTAARCHLTQRSLGPVLSIEARGSRTAKAPATKSAVSHKTSPSGQTSTSARRLRPRSRPPQFVSYWPLPLATAFASIRPWSTRGTSVDR